jgi:hypothetical protein
MAAAQNDPKALDALADESPPAATDEAEGDSDFVSHQWW